jgi:Right handed beta helix region
VRRQHQGADRERGWPIIVAAATAFCLLATAPLILPLIHVHLHPVAATSSHGVKLLPAPTAPRSVALPSVARPIDPGAAPAASPTGDATQEASLVTKEDNRIRALLHDTNHILKPQLVATFGSLPTLVLSPARRAYTSADLIKYHALVMLPNHVALLQDNVFVAADARLTLGGSALRTLYLNNGRGGFATIVTWGGTLSFAGSAAQPMTIMGWDRTASRAATDVGTGRSYLRDVGGRMTLSEVRVSSLGFWSGRTGGVAWSGATGLMSGGSATSSTFTGNAYGAFVSRGDGIVFNGDLFESNELDGLHIHRYSDDASVMNSSAVRNGGSGFSIGPATGDVQLTNDVSEHNAGDGYFVNGKPLATSASASGGATTPGSGTLIKNSAALRNGKIGILVEGGTGAVVESDQICAAVTAVAIRYNVTDSVVTGNDIGCSPRSGLSLGPGTPGLTVSGNSIAGARIGILLSSSGPVKLDNNQITGATVFGISARGPASAITGVGDAISGTGPRAIDARTNASTPALSSANVSGWTSDNPVTFVSYLEYHPLAALWLGVAVLILMGWAWSHRHHLPSHPYANTRRRGTAPPALAGETSTRTESSLASLFTTREPAVTTTTPLRALKAATTAAGALRRTRSTPARPTLPDMRAASGGSGGSGLAEWQRERGPANGRPEPSQSRGRPSGRGRQGASPNQQGVSPGQQGVSPGQQGVSSGQERVGPGWQGVSPGWQGVSPGWQGASPGWQSAGPGQQGASPGQTRPATGGWERPASQRPEPRHSRPAHESEPSWDSAGRRIPAGNAAPGSARPSAVRVGSARAGGVRAASVTAGGERASDEQSGEWRHGMRDGSIRDGGRDSRPEPGRPAVPEPYQGRRRSRHSYETPLTPPSRPGGDQ